MRTDAWVILGYFAAGLLSWRYFAGLWWRLYGHCYYVTPANSIGSGAALAAFWPFSVAYFVGLYLWDNHQPTVRRVLIHEPRHKRQERKLREARERVIRLERELDLDASDYKQGGES